MKTTGATLVMRMLDEVVAVGGNGDETGDPAVRFSAVKGKKRRRQETQNAKITRKECKETVVPDLEKAASWKSLKGLEEQMERTTDRCRSLYGANAESFAISASVAEPTVEFHPEF